MESRPILGFDKIVAAVDGSKSAVDACRVAGWIAEKTKGSVVLLEVLQHGALSGVIHGDEFEARLVDEARKRLGKEAEVVGHRGVTTAIETVQGQASVVKSIVDYTAEKGTSLIVMGTRSHGGIQRMLLGSVSSGVATHASCSVLVVRGGPPKDRAPFKRILVAFDGSENSTKAVKAAAELSKVTGGELTVLHVIHIPSFAYTTGSEAAIDKIEKEGRKNGEDLLSAAAALLRAEGVTAKKQLVEELQSPAMRIVKQARASESDLIVIGARGVGGFERLMLGSVALGILNYAKRSVLVVR